MQSFHQKFFKQYPILALVVLLLFGTSGCQYINFTLPFDLSSKIPFLKDDSDPAIAETEKPGTDKAPPIKTQSKGDNSSARIKKIYIQNFSGQKVEEVQKIFFNAAEEQSYFTFVELLPDNLEELGVLRIDVADYNVWEIDEKASDLNDYPTSSIKPDDSIKRINAIVSLKVNLFDAKTGKRLVTRRFTQPFQQIYVGKEAISNRPENSIELNRLTKLLIFNMLDSFLSKEEISADMEYEKGLADDWIVKKIYNMGNSRIRKGIRLAKAGKLDEAIWVWRITLFTPKGDEPENIYLYNRASAYYNLGIAYQMTKDWWKAAEMFSHANRIQQKLKYAQAWGNSLQIWLEEQKNPQPIKSEPAVVKTTENKVQLDEKTKPLSVKSIEENNQLLLKPRILWPLDPYLKNQEHLGEIKNTDQ